MITNELVIKYINELYHPINDDLALLRKKGEDGHIPIILKDTETLLKVLLDMKKPLKILEVGTAIGYSAAMMATYCPYAEIYTVENDPLYINDAEENLEEYRNVHIVKCDGRNMSEHIHDKFDFVFIDAAKSHYRKFWDEALKLINPGSIIVCDNVIMKGSIADKTVDKKKRFVTNIKYMREFLSYITNLTGVSTTVLAAGDGVSISVLK